MFQSLDGLFKFSLGDKTEWSSVNFDDSSWSTIRVPGSWQSQGVAPMFGTAWYGWYRTTLSQETMSVLLKMDDPALFLGLIGDADETYLNGMKIGGEGLLGNGFVEATKVERLYRIPKGTLLQGGKNVLAIRVQNTYIEGGIFTGPVLAGEYGDLLTIKLAKSYHRKNVEVFFIALVLFCLLTCVFMFVNGVREREYVTIGVFFSLYLAMYGLDSLLFYETGLKSHAVEKIIIAIVSLLPAVFLVFLTSIFRTRAGRLQIPIVTFSLLMSSALLFLPYSKALALAGTYAWVLLLALSGGAGTFIVVRACIMKMNESVPVMFGAVAIFGGTLADSVQLLNVPHFSGLAPSEVGQLFFILSLMYALTARYVRFRKEAAALSDRILTAHEEERKRLSRELHDGVGQSLLAVKLKLQMLGSGKEDGAALNEGIGGLIDEVSGSINELRNVAQGLRPSFLEEMDLTDAVKWYCKSFSEKTGTRIKVETDGPIAAGGKIKDNIYRICQEALGNAVKHSGSDRIDLELKRTGTVVSLNIRDYGKGIAAGSKSDADRGIGISTMKERTELLGGLFMMESSVKNGTAIKIEVPVND